MDETTGAEREFRQAQAEWKMVSSEQVRLIQSWLGIGVGGAMSASHKPPSELSPKTMRMYRRVITLNIARGTQDSGVVRERVSKIDAALSMLGESSSLYF